MSDLAKCFIPENVTKLIRADDLEVVIGIDPGVKTGVAVLLYREDKISFVRSTDFAGTVALCDEYDRDKTIVVVEDGGGISPVWHKAKTQKAQNKTSKHVGGNNRESDLVAQFVKRLGFMVFRRRPNQFKSKAKFSTAEQHIQWIARTTGFTGKTNEHNRDAIAMIYGVNWRGLIRTQRKVKGVE